MDVVYVGDALIWRISMPKKWVSRLSRAWEFYLLYAENRNFSDIDYKGDLIQMPVRDYQGKWHLIRTRAELWSIAWQTTGRQQ
jgi:hypothetical protein